MPETQRRYSESILVALLVVITLMAFISQPRSSQGTNPSPGAHGRAVAFALSESMELQWRMWEDGTVEARRRDMNSPEFSEWVVVEANMEPDKKP